MTSTRFVPDFLPNVSLSDVNEVDETKLIISKCSLDDSPRSYLYAGLGYTDGLLLHRLVDGHLVGYVHLHQYW